MILRQKLSFLSLWTSEHARDVLEVAQALWQRQGILVVFFVYWLELMAFLSLLISVLAGIAYDVWSSKAADHGITLFVFSLLTSIIFWIYIGDHARLFLLDLLCLLLELFKAAQEVYFSSLTVLRYSLRVGFKQMDSPSLAF